jgi:DNA polymerase-1
MRHLIFTEAATYDTAIIIKNSALNKDGLIKHYIEPLKLSGFSEDQFIGFNAKYDDKGKCPMKLVMQPHLDNLLPSLDSLGVKNLLVCDSAYFKKLAGVQKAEVHYGYSLPCKIKGYEHFNIVLAPNYQRTFYDNEIKDKLAMSLVALKGLMTGNYQAPGQGIIKSEVYPRTRKEVSDFLDSLHQYPMLTADIETKSLRFYSTGVSTISFAWDEGNGGAFEIDHELEIGGSKMAPYMGYDLLRKFFESYEGKLIWHGSTFDLKVLVYKLYMKGLDDINGMLKGIDIMTKNFHDSMIILYLSTNSAAGNVLKLKDAAQEFAGNYAMEDIDDTSRIPVDKLLRYNLVDTLSTWYVYNKHMPRLIADNQESIYNNILLPSVKTVLQMELTGIPLDYSKVGEADAVLSQIVDNNFTLISKSKFVKHYEKVMKAERLILDNEKLVKKVRTAEEVEDMGLTFNPGSGTQLARILHGILKFPVIEKTKGGAPSTKIKVLKALLHRTKDPEEIEFLDAIIKLSEAAKILNTFVSAFKTKSCTHPDGTRHLYGGFKIGGTVSGRMSSADPNLQNLPSSGTIYAKLIKQCVVAPKGWIVAGADFSSLEDRISGLVTKDPNKLRVYMGHEIYELEIDGTVHHIRDDATINFDGKTYTGEEFYAAYTNGRQS